MIVRERAFGPCGGRAFGPSEREARRQQKMAAKFGFSLIGKREFLRDPKKYTFGKTNFKTFYKTRIFEILPPFLSTLDTWMDTDIFVFLSVDGGSKKFFYARTFGPRSTCTTTQTHNSY